MSQPFIDPVPPEVEQRLAAARSGDDCVLIRVLCDLDDRLAFRRRWLEVTDHRLLVVSQDSTEPMIELPLSELEEMRFDVVVGGGCMVIGRRGSAPCRLYCSNSSRVRLSEVTKAIQNLSRGRPLGLPSRLEITRCPQCGRLLPEVDARCPNCLEKLAVLRRILAYLQPHWALATALLLATALGTSAELLPPLIIKYVIDNVLTPAADWEMLGWCALGLMGVRLVVWGSEVCRGWLGVLLGARMTTALRSQVYRRLQAVSLRYFDQRPIGSTMARLTSDVERVEEFLVSAAPLLIMNVLMLGGIVVFLLVTSWKLTLYVLAPIPAIALAARLSWAPVKRAWARQADRWARLSDRVSQSFGGIREVKAFGQEWREIQSFARQHDELVRASILGERLSFGFFTVLYFLMGLGQISIWYLGGREVLAGELSLGTLLAVIAYLWMLYWPLQWLGQVHQAMVQALTGAERIFEVLDTPLESRPGRDAVPLPEIRGEVRFEGVTFGYDAARPVVHDINLDVKPGERIAIVGRSGAGKTTLINLLCRFYRPDVGRILVDGVDLRHVKGVDLRAQLAVVLQEPFLFSGSITENIRYGRPDASFVEVMAAARAANAHDFILTKEDGYDTEVGERGDRLSGGERQRVAVARALLRDPRILILDEATSSVDAQSDQLIRDAIMRLAANRTTIIIAHKLSTVRTADRFVVIDQGRVSEAGRYDELMQRRGAFYDLVHAFEPEPLAS